MATPRVIQLGGQPYVMVATIDEGRDLFCYAGRAIAVEKMDMRPGSTEFDHQADDRAVRGGQPEDIAATQDHLDREFMEGRVKSNL